MAAILYSTAQIGDTYAPSLNAAFAKIFAESGIKPIVLSPLGGERTIAQEESVGGTSASDHVKQRAVDINNQRQLRNWDETRFLAIMAEHGWRNVTEYGHPFPTEPWHFANQSSTPESSSSIPLPNNAHDQEDTMKIALLANDGNGLLGAKNATHSYVFTPDLFWETTGDPSANYVSVQAAAPQTEAWNATYAELYKYASLAARCDPALLAGLKAAAGK